MATNGSSYQRRDVKTSMLFPDEDLYQADLKAKGGKVDLWQGGDIYYPFTPKTAHDVTIEDIGGREQDFTLDNSGFFIGKHAFKSVVATEDLSDIEKIKEQYFPEVEQWLKEVTGASRALVFDYGTRSSTSTDNADNRKKGQVSRPIFVAHVDQSSWQAGNVLHRNLPGETECLLRGRVMIVNVWRPIKTVYKHPLAVASATSVPATDFVFRPGRVFQDVNESMLVKYNPKHKWYYKFAQQPDEVLVFKQYDNYGKVRACPHTAFTDEEFEDGEMGRESIEVRVLLFWPGFFEDGE